jgi:uncharacterized phage protein (TIGR01671 family)
MRKLKNKSRVWCKNLRIFSDIPYHSSDGHHLLWHHTGNEISLSRTDGLDTESGTSDYIFNRYCEFDDSNGREIYEDDLVQTKVHDDWSNDRLYNVTYLVKWSFIQSGWRGFTRRMLETGGSDRYSGNPLGAYRKVVGNIHQNPDFSF